jgi:hypothetical protein
VKKEQGIKIVCHLLKDLTCYSPCARVLALREILENSIDNEQAKHFGAKEKFEPHFEEMPLLHQNHKQVFIIFYTKIC